MELLERIETRKDVQAVYYRLTGKDYPMMNYDMAWEKLMEYAQNMKVVGKCGAEAEYINMYLDDPTVGNEVLRCDVCIADPIINTLKPMGDIGIKTIEGGKFLVFLLKGAYSQLSDLYTEIYKRLGHGDVKPKNECPVFEKYLNDPSTTPTDELLTEIWIPIE
jgi:AraC family transcriptional regulator